MADSCLGMSFLGHCSYFPDGSGWSILSFGDTIAAIALLLAFSQLQSLTRKEIIKEVLVKSYWLWGMGVVFILISSVLPFIPGKALPLIGYPIVWQFASSVIFLVLIISLIKFYHSDLKFGGKHSERTLSVVNKVIIKGGIEDLAELSSILESSIKDIVKFISKYSSFGRKMAEDAGREYKIEIDTEIASHLIKLFADPEFSKVVVTKNPIFSIKLFDELGRQKTNGDIARPLVWAVVDQALKNKNSILYREKSYNGLGLYKDFTNCAFSNASFNNEMLPLNHWTPILIKEIDIEMFELYSNCFAVLIDCYLGEKRFYEHSFYIYSPGKSLVEFVSYVMHRVDTVSEQDVYSSFPVSSLQIATRTIKEIIQKLEEAEICNDEVYIQYLNEVEERRDYTIINYIADWTFELLKAASYTRKHDFVMRSYLIDLWIVIYPITDRHESEIQRQIQKRLEKMLFNQFKVNLIEGYYPAVSRTVISILGLWRAPIVDSMKQEDIFRNKFYDLVKENFSRLYKKDKNRALDKLPFDVHFDEERSCLIQHVRFFEEPDRELEIDRAE